MQELLNLSRFKKYLPISNYINFTDPRFDQNEGASSVLIDCNFQYFIFTVPETIIVTLLLYFIHLLTKKRKFHKFVKIFRYVKPVILQLLFQ